MSRAGPGFAGSVAPSFRQGFFPAGFDGSTTHTWAIALVDVDQDGDVDLLHADDQAGAVPAAAGGVDAAVIHLFENDGTGQFTDVTPEVGLDRLGDWMGLSFGDVNADGHLDVFGANLGDYATTPAPDPHQRLLLRVFRRSCAPPTGPLAILVAAMPLRTRASGINALNLGKLMLPTPPCTRRSQQAHYASVTPWKFATY